MAGFIRCILDLSGGCEAFSDLQVGAEGKSRLVTEAIHQTNPRGIPIVLRRAGVAAVRCSARLAPNEGPAEMVGISSENGRMSARQGFRIKN